MNKIDEKYKDYQYSIYMTTPQNLMERLEETLKRNALNYLDEMAVNDALVYMKNHFFYMR